MDNINLNYFKVFLEVAKSKSFLEASNKLFISQPAVSRSIANLEQDLNIHVFKLDDFDGIELTYQQLSAIMFMIEE
jgi:DNA-binding transcriptional LysR family regulator